MFICYLYLSGQLFYLRIIWYLYLFFLLLLIICIIWFNLLLWLMFYRWGRWITWKLCTLTKILLIRAIIFKRISNILLFLKLNPNLTNSFPHSCSYPKILLHLHFLISNLLILQDRFIFISLDKIIEIFRM